MRRKLYNLSWYKNMNILLHFTDSRLPESTIQAKSAKQFDRFWNEKRKKSKNLTHYNQVKKDTSISFESILALDS